MTTSPSSQIVVAVGPEHIEATPRSLAETHQALIERHAHLSEKLPAAKEFAATSAAVLREIKQEMQQIERSIAALERIRTPKRRKRT